MGYRIPYGMCPNAQAWFNVFGAVFGAYGIVPHGWMLRDGEVVWGGDSARGQRDPRPFAQVGTSMD